MKVSTSFDAESTLIGQNSVAELNILAIKKTTKNDHFCHFPVSLTMHQVHNHHLANLYRVVCASKSDDKHRSVHSFPLNKETLSIP